MHPVTGCLFRPELNLKLGRVTQVEIDQNTQNLPDLEAQCEKLDIEKEDKDLN